MRVISGRLGGRTFDSPSGHRTHPMSEKMRGALFNILGDIDGMTVLDAFAGTGALSFEAISRGANQAIALDVDKNANTIIVSNIQKLQLGLQIKPIRANASSWSDNNPDMYFDLVLCDPPYDAVNQDLLIKLAEHAQKDGIVVYSLPPTTQLKLPEDAYQSLLAKSYGDSQLLFFRKI